MVTTFVISVGALLTLGAALLLFKVGINMGHRMTGFNEVLERTKKHAEKTRKKQHSGASRNFVPSKFN